MRCHLASDGVFEPHDGTIQRHRPAVRGCDARKRPREFVAPGIEQTGHAENFSAMQRERDIGELARTRQALYIEHDLTAVHDLGLPVALVR